MEETKIFLENSKFPLVIKADGLASGKGVYICKKFSDAIKASEEIFGGKFGTANSILIEEFLEGEEMSYFIVSDGNEFKFFGTAQDHKRVGEGDSGKNTGGMGCYSPSRLFNKELDKKIATITREKNEQKNILNYINIIQYSMSEGLIAIDLENKFSTIV